jgi:hypothetical protein
MESTLLAKILSQIQANPKILSSSSIKFENISNQTIINELITAQETGLIYSKIERDESNEIVFLSDLELLSKGERYLTSLKLK